MLRPVYRTTIGLSIAWICVVTPLRALPIYQNAVIGLPCRPIAVLDVDLDSHLDLVLCEGQVLLGDGKGNFPTPFHIPADGCTSMRDFNKDQIPDLLCSGSPANILLGLGAGRYQDPSPLPVNGEVVSGDFNSDGAPDVAVSSGFLVLGNESGGFGAPIPLGFSGPLAVGDFNGDRRDDLLVRYGQPSVNLAILLNLGSGLFLHADIQDFETIINFEVGDVDNDGITDIVYGRFADPFILVRGNALGEFHREMTIPANSYGSSFVLADFNGDGNLDFAHVSGTREGGVLLGQGNGHFENSRSIPQRRWGFLLQHGDVNGDGREDLVYTGGLPSGPAGAAVLLSAENGSFGTHILKEEHGFPATVGDVNFDGLDDTVYLHPQPPYLTLFINRGESDFEGQAIPWRGPIVAAVLHDMDADHLDDLIVLDETGLGIARALGEGRFAPPLFFDTPSPQRELRVINANHDSFPDALVYSGEEICVYLGSGGISLSVPRCTPAAVGLFAVRTGDLNGDHISDFGAMSHPFEGGKLSLLEGTGDASFGEPVLFAQDIASFTFVDSNGDGVDELWIGEPAFGVAIRDFNADGTPDFLYYDCIDVGCLMFSVRMDIRSADETLPRSIVFPEIGLEYFDFDINKDFLTADMNGDSGPDVLVWRDWSGPGVLLMLNQEPGTNHFPVANAVREGDVECQSTGGAEVVLDGSSSSDADSTPGSSDDVVSYGWYEDLGLPTMRFIGDGKIRRTTLPLGAHDISLLVRDRAGKPSIDNFVVNVVDTMSPHLEIRPSPNVLWPPDNRLAPIRVEALATDSCGAARFELESIQSNEPLSDSSSGAPDVVDADFGTGDVTFQLRAERLGNGTGRIYSVRYRAMDASGNPTSIESRITVPISLSRGKSR